MDLQDEWLASSGFCQIISKKAKIQIFYKQPFLKHAMAGTRNFSK